MGLDADFKCIKGKEYAESLTEYVLLTSFILIASSDLTCGLKCIFQHYQNCNEAISYSVGAFRFHLPVDELIQTTTDTHGRHMESHEPGIFLLFVFDYFSLSTLFLSKHAKF